MFNRRRRILLSEIGRQCGFAMMAYGDATAAIQKRESERFWYSLEALVTAASRLHELLWPAAGSSMPADEELRRVLGVDDDSPLNGAPLSSACGLIATLESWNALRPGQPPLLSNLGPAGFAEPAPAECVRCFAPATGIFTLYGSAIELPPLLHAVAGISQKVEEELQQLRTMV
ncbi:MAG TPA: hypothetical protein VMH81_33685 [Bryobacteraceae bacterium]|nr:hypothetical protein [Bryobacteraceae bacterium]